ncbi:MAG: RHS repeat protein, partial [Kiritimatiellae bacterium]|nr:RHS repeat protein [Kiritimatiellia bacterium]
MMVNHAFSMLLVAGLAAGVALWDAVIDLVTDPPAVVCEGDWLSGCERVTGGVELVAVDAPDVSFSFEGLPTEVLLGYEVIERSSGAVLFSGEGGSVPLSFVSGDVKVRFYALSGEVDWAEVSTISATAEEPLAALPVSSVATSTITSVDPASAQSQIAPVVEEVQCFRKIVSGGEITVSLVDDVDEGFEIGGVTVEPGQTVSGIVSAFPEGFAKNYPNNHGALSIEVLGMATLNGNYTLQVGADDNVSVSIGNGGASLSGEAAFRMGEEVAFSGTGLQSATLSYSSVGGPAGFSINLEPSVDLCHYGVVPYGQLSISPNPVALSWSNTNPIPISVNVQSSADVTHTVLGGGQLSGSAQEGFSISPSDFFGANTNGVQVVISAIETYVDSHPQNSTPQTHTLEGTLNVLPPTTSLSLSSKNLTVTNGSDGGFIQATGADEPILTYTVGGNYLEAYGMNLHASADLLAARDTLKLQNITTNIVYNTEVNWTAYYGNKEVASGSEPVTINLEITPKVRKDLTCCVNGTTTDVDLSCVSFQQRFGRTPLLAGMPEGMLMIEEENLSEALFTPAVLRYNHPMMRRLDVATRVVTEPDGHLLTYDVDGIPCGADVASDSRLIQQPDGVFHERFPDRSIVEYDASGTVVALISPQGVRAGVDELGITVEYAASGAISKITSVADGVLEITVDSPTAYRIVWTDTEGDVAKTLVFTKENEATLCLVDNTNYPTRWTWDESIHDFVMTRGEPEEATTVERRVVYSGTQATVTKTYSKDGVVASEETEIIDAVNGNAVVGRTSGGRSVYSATRVTEGNGLGKMASTTDALGAVTSYTYDAQGRILTETTTGTTTNVVSYIYAADIFDRRPWSTVETQDGDVIRDETFSDVMLLDGTRIETTTVCGLATIRQFYPATSENRFEAGKIQAVVRPDGRMTTYAYDADTLIVTQTEGVADEDVVFTLVEGKSTRTLTTYDVRGNAVRIEKEAWIDGAWHPLTWETRSYSAAHKHLGSVYSNGLSKDSRWNCTGPLWEIGTDTIATTNRYNTLKQMVTSTRYGSFGALTTTYTYDGAGNVVRTQRGDLVSERTYDTGGRLTSETDEQGRVTTYAYPNEQTTIMTSPSGATRQTVRDSQGRTLSITGSGVTPEYHTYGANWQKVTYGSPDGARWIKTFTDGLGRTVRTETAGANDSVIVSVNTYNDKGQLIRTETDGEAPVVYTYNVWGEVTSTQRGDRTPQETESAYILVDGEPWLEEVNRLGNLVQRRRSDAEGFVQVATDVRGNATLTAVEIDGAEQTTTTTLPGVTNPQVQVTLDGVTVEETDTAGVTQTSGYDVYRRLVSQTDGRNNTTTRAYDVLGRLASVTDAAGAVTAYAYDTVGNVSAVTNALGNVVTYAYDVRGNKIYEGGATYPVAYEYDTFGRKVKMTTFR